MLDRPLSRKRIILLVQIGKEGWDCKSLTGIILSQEKDCPKSMVLVRIGAGRGWWRCRMLRVQCCLRFAS